MEPLLTRIYIEHVQGATIAYLYNRESFDLLKIKKQQYDNSQFIEVGDIIEYEDRKYVVRTINFKMCEKMDEVEKRLGYGVNMYAPTDPSNYSCQIGLFVDNA